MKKILFSFMVVVISLNLFGNLEADAAIKSTSNTIYRVLVTSDLAPAAISIYGYHEEDYFQSSSSTYYYTKYRSAHIQAKTSVPKLTYTQAVNRVYNGSTLLDQTSAYSTYYPNYIAPTGSQNYFSQNSENLYIPKSTGKSVTTLGANISCSTYAPCVFGMDLTIQY